MLYSPSFPRTHTHTHTPPTHTHTHPTHTHPIMLYPPPSFPRTDDVDKLRDQLDLYISEKGELLQTLEIAQKDLEMLMSKDSGAGGMEGGCGYTNIKNFRTVLHNFTWSQQFSLNGIIFSCSWGCRKFLKLQSPPKPSIVTTVGMWMHSGSRLQSTLQGEQPLLPHMYICLIDTGTDCVYCTVQVVSQWRPSRRWRGREMTSGKCWKIRYVQ